MSLERVKKISLDFYNNAIISVNAKQYDTLTRYINVTCTDSGKKFHLNPESMSVFVRYKKADGKEVFNNAVILEEDGSVQIELTQQMLAASGRNKLDLLILNKSGLLVENFADVKSFYDLGVQVISTMTFYVNTSPASVDHNNIASSNEFDALLGGISKMEALEKNVIEKEKERQEAETARENAENDRDDAELLRSNSENERIANEIKRQDDITGEAYRIKNENERIANEIKRQDDITGEAYRIANETARDNAETLRTETYKELSENTEALIERINSAVDSGYIFYSEKGTVNGVATLDENGYIPSSQLNIHQTLYGYEDPSNDLGNDGDYYFKIIKRVNE